MNKIKGLLFFAMLFLGTAASGQSNEKTVSKFAKGTVLTEADLGFLSMVSNATLAASRGAAKMEATIAGKTYHTGQTLSKNDATAIIKAITDFRKTNPGEKTPVKTTETARGGLCWYWYYYCDGYGYCWWYKYWYYC